jgi:DNA polymerase-4
MLARLSEMVGRRLREHGFHARTIQVKLRYSDFSTFTRAVTLDHATFLDTEILNCSRRLFRKNWTGAAIRLIGVHASGFTESEGQLNLFEGEKSARWTKALNAVDRLRDKYGEQSVSLASGLKSKFRERTHENPADLPGKGPKA